MPSDFNVAVLISGRGSNLEKLINCAEDYTVKAVFSNKVNAPGLEHARKAGISSLGFNRRDYKSLKDFKAAIFDAVRKSRPDLVALAGFMLIVDPEFVEEFYGRLVNIHPSLLPAYPGLDTHRRALEAGERFHGCTVHFVDAGVDTGPIIAQARCPVLPGDTADTLARRVLNLEHKLYPWVVNSIARGNIWLQNNAVEYTPGAVGEARARNFILNLSRKED
ncbi:MAG: phosphoribosylglycinamide formyltransferase [Candidatus Dadabacteria bacterium]|nr:MAG: phosphoribosylglycinamide formyltransferase [Candidatus Dadabacteria bacterium]